MEGQRQFIAGFAFVLVLLTSSAGYSQSLSVTASGSKKVILSNAVGDNQFVWVSDAPLEKTQGTAGGVGGVITLDPHNLTTIKGTIAAQVATMKTGSEMRDDHLKGSVWLDASKYPKISYTISKVQNIIVKGNSATGMALGTFSMHGVTKEISIPFKLVYIDESA